jgi:thiamine biosynthesis lipoprotein
MSVTPRHRFAFHAMAGEHELMVCGASDTAARRAADAAIADVARIEAKYSRYRNDSVTTRINRAAGGVSVPIDAETAALLHYADRCFALSDGKFDITSGVLRRVWDFRAASPRLPDAHALASARALIGWRDVEWDDNAIRLPRAGMEVDFGGLGKEYAADRMATICREHGIDSGLVNLGGDVRAIGAQPDGAPWRIGIRNPRAPDRAVAGVDVVDAAVATSGDYERFVLIDGVRYCHLLDPATGMPVSHWRSISVVAPLCIVAGSLATIAMLLEARAEAFLHAQGASWLAIDAAGAVTRSATMPWRT